MRAIIVGTLVIGLVTAAAGPASAQDEVVRPGEWSRGTTLSGFAGMAMDSKHNGPAIGGVIGYEVTPRLTIEGGGSWFEFGDGASAFAGSIKLRARLWGQRTVDPFLTGGVGFYRASFDRASNVAPGFYQRRMRMPATGLGDTSFTDPALVAGAGMNIFVTRHFAVRPDVETLIVLRDRRSHVVTTLSLHAVFHIESHPVTPRVR
jgi:hypothetical protein